MLQWVTAVAECCWSGFVVDHTAETPSLHIKTLPAVDLHQLTHKLRRSQVAPHLWGSRWGGATDENVLI